MFVRMLTVHCDQNNSYEITINGFQGRKINEIRNVRLPLWETFLSIKAEVWMFTKLNTYISVFICFAEPEELMKEAEEEELKRQRIKAARRSSKKGQTSTTPSRLDCGLRFVTVRSTDPQAHILNELQYVEMRRNKAKRRFRYCYECARSLGGCQEINYSTL